MYFDIPPVVGKGNRKTDSACLCSLSRWNFMAVAAIAMALFWRWKNQHKEEIARWEAKVMELIREIKTLKTLVEDPRVDSWVARVSDLTQQVSEKDAEIKGLKTLVQNQDANFAKLQASSDAEVKELKRENASLSKLLDAQVLVDEEVWQFQGDCGEWVPFQAPLKSYEELLDFALHFQILFSLMFVPKTLASMRFQ